MTSNRRRPEEISGQLLIEAREQAGYTQMQLARLLRADQTKISRFELGKVPTLPALLGTIADYCEAVDCDWHDVLAPYFERSNRPRLAQVAS